MEKSFRVTISGLRTGLRVSHISTFSLRTCSATLDVAEVFGDPSLEEFDQIPVRERFRIVGVLERRQQQPLGGSVRQHMLPLDDSLLVSADESLTRFVPLLRKRPYRLVLLGTEIKGIVTRSDISKPPVRLLAFTLVSQVETLMTGLIRCAYGEGIGWKEYLDKSHQKKLEARLRRRKAQNLVLPMLELADLGDKRIVLTKLCGLSAAEQEELRELEELRNATDHTRDYARTDAELNTFIDRLSLAKKWIGRLTEGVNRTV